MLPIQDRVLLFPGMLVYAGLVLFIAGLFLFRRNNTFLASSFCSFAALNITRATLLICVHAGVLPSGATGNVLDGCLLESFAYIALSPWFGALRINVVMVLTLICTFVGYVLAGLPFLANQTVIGGWAHAGHIGGYFMFAAAAFAYYGGTALLVNTAWHRPLLPIGGQA